MTPPLFPPGVPPGDGARPEPARRGATGMAASPRGFAAAGIPLLGATEVPSGFWMVAIGTVGVLAVVWIVSLRRQVAQRRRAEEQVREANAELERRVASRTAELHASYAREKELHELKSRFVSLISHEYRTPLGIIMASAEILDAYFDRLPPEERRTNLRDITQASRQMARMLDEVLLLGRVEAGKMTFRPVPVRLTELGRRMVEEVTSATGGRCPVAFSVSPDGDPGEAVADAALLRHILGNLLNNAVKYSPAGSPVEFAVTLGERVVGFRIEDRGIGIPDDDARLLFQAFHRGRNVGEAPGSGLGMTIVKRCLDLHGGRLAFQSVEGRGTVFIVALPRTSPAETGPDELPRFIESLAAGRSLTLSA